jgi:hypothetical protein
MGDSITTQIIHHQNAMLKSTKQQVLTNLNDIDAFIEMETPEAATFGHNGMFTLREAFLSYKDDAGEPIFSAIEATQSSGTYRLLFNDCHHAAVDMILTDIEKKSRQSETGMMYQSTTDTSQWMMLRSQVKTLRHKEHRSGRNITS